MSEISVLSNQYEKLVQTSDKINSSVIVVKKKDLLNRVSSKKNYPKLHLSADQFNEAMTTLLDFLQNLFSLLNEENSRSEDLPLIILEDYKAKLSQTPYFKEDLRNLINDIKENKVLNDKDIQILDRVLAVLDNERTLLFRKLRTARG
jgi:hypothetical protein